MRLLLMSAALILVATTVLAADFPWPPQILFDQFQGEREMLDLQAQQDMATWALWMLVATGCSTLVGAAGTVAVVLNIKQTRAALKEAQRSNEEAQRSNDLLEKHNRIETRPYLVVSKFEAAHFSISKNAGSVDVYLKGFLEIKNVGKTPCPEAIITCQINRYDEEAKGRQRGGVSKSVAVAPGETVRLSVLEDQSFAAKKWQKSDSLLTIHFKAEYSDHHRDQDYSTTWHGFFRIAGNRSLATLKQMAEGTFTMEIEDGKHLFFT